MSGIAGLVARGGAPAEASRVDRMAACLGARGPDGAASRVDGAVGLAHALLRTGDVGDDVRSRSPWTDADGWWRTPGWMGATS
jgi:asparagine synthetase B (glutamine-hydrolysing)